MQVRPGRRKRSVAEREVVRLFCLSGCERASGDVGDGYTTIFTFMIIPVFSFVTIFPIELRLTL